MYFQEDEGIPQESEKPIVPVKQIKKISLNSKYHGVRNILNSFMLPEKFEGNI